MFIKRIVSSLHKLAHNAIPEHLIQALRNGGGGRGVVFVAVDFVPQL